MVKFCCKRRCVCFWNIGEPLSDAFILTLVLSFIRMTGVQVQTLMTPRLYWQWRRSGLCSRSCWLPVTSVCVPTRHTDTVVSVPSDVLLSACFRNRKGKIATSAYLDINTFFFSLDNFPPGILNDDGTLNNDASCLRLAEVALAYAQAGNPCFFCFFLLCLYFMSLPSLQNNGTILPFLDPLLVGLII